jgi:hypothetical protein
LADISLLSSGGVAGLTKRSRRDEPAPGPRTDLPAAA